MGSWVGDEGLEVRVWGVGSKVRFEVRGLFAGWTVRVGWAGMGVWGFVIRGREFGFDLLGLPQGSEGGDQGFEFGVEGLGFGVWSFGFGV